LLGKPLDVREVIVMISCDSDNAIIIERRVN